MLSKVTKKQEPNVNDIVQTFDFIVDGIANSGRLKQEAIELINITLRSSELTLHVFDTFPSISVNMLTFFYDACSTETLAVSDASAEELYTNFTSNFLANIQAFRSEVSKFNLLFHHARAIATKCKTLKLHLARDKSKQLHFNENSARNWYQALKYCAVHNSTLISVESEAEQRSISDFLADNFSANMSFHVGAFHDMNEEDFFWLATGAVVNANVKPPGCLALDFKSNVRDSTFSIIDCMQPQGFICQKLIRS